ncbi:RNA polymerase sigma factor [Spirosoma validum]|uniref:Sigma-70 family RNA polymerase sigma factor n=1 Tax=Spirosoma validum TaxID=2771355 RepID=A0A927B817_9BACT|nr:sigma-70 family RNA polymerase sigma factor [Spirosoma validum]MBD2756902.1 sigma-70 family RNA polymerase sigma factor [Spirosoma validum]
MKKSFTDQQIVDGLQSKQVAITEDIVTYLYEQCQRNITNLVTRKGGSEDDANDLFQETILAFLQNVWTSKYQVHHDAKVTTYIYGIASNLWLKEWTKRNAVNQRHEKYSRNQLLNDRSPEEVLIDEDELRSAWALFGKLGKTCQDILTAFYFDKKTMQEIADDFNLGTADNAKTRKYRCIQALKKLVTTP